MKIYYLLHFALASVTLTTASDISIKGDLCSKFDSCRSKPHLRTCSCAVDCSNYGTCCYNVTNTTKQQFKSVASSSPFQCYHGGTATSLFVKRSCADNYEGHIHDAKACAHADADEMDVSNNLLVTSLTTNTTYWNMHCAACSNEAKDDLELWNIEVFCPRKEEVNRWLIRKNLTFDEDTRQWGLKIDGEFLQCVVKYTPPSSIDEVKYCTPNLISSCPQDYNNKHIADKCSQYYGERKHKHSDKFYRNIHCAICNGVDMEELECPGMSKPEDNVDETDFGDMVEEVFTNGQWLTKKDGKQFPCSKGFLYDPFWKKCRKWSEDMAPVQILESSSQRCKFQTVVLSIALIVFVL